MDVFRETRQSENYLQCFPRYSYMSITWNAKPPAKDAASTWWLDQQQLAEWHHHSRRETFETKLTSFTSTPPPPSFISSHRFTSVAPKTSVVQPTFRSGTLSYPPRPSSLVLPPLFSSFTLRRSTHFGSLLVSFSSYLFSLLIWAGIWPHLDHVQDGKTHAQFVAVGCMPVGWPLQSPYLGGDLAIPRPCPRRQDPCSVCGSRVYAGWVTRGTPPPQPSSPFLLGWSLGFNQRKPPSRTIAIAVDILRAFDMVSHRLLIEMIHHSCLYQQHHSPSRKVQAGLPQGSVISLALFNHFVSDCPISNLNMMSYANDFTLLASAPSIVKDEARANQLCSSLVRWTVGRWRAICHYSPAIQRDTVHLGSPVPTPPVGDAEAPLNRTPKILCIRLNPLHLQTSHSRLFWAGFEGSQCHESSSWVELGFHNQNSGGHLQGHGVPHPQLAMPPPSGSPKCSQPIWTSLR